MINYPDYTDCNELATKKQKFSTQLKKIHLSNGLSELYIQRAGLNPALCMYNQLLLVLFIIDVIVPML
jgi:hypothetical protein